MSGWQLARSDVLSLKGYRPAEQRPDTIRLNANEAPEPLYSDNPDQALNRYPEPHPVQLQKRLAQLFSVPKDNLLVTRGSSEAIDVLLRTFCRAYEDNVITATPTFEMYGFYAAVQGVDLQEVPLVAEQDFSLDIDLVLGKCNENTKLVFVCSPNNPTGSMVSRADIMRLAESRHDRSIIVVDEAYIEFSAQESMTSHIADFDNLVVLRTLSKARALAAARCGVAIACAELVDVFCRVLPPYSFPTPVINSVLTNLAAGESGDADAAITELISERERLFEMLGKLAAVARVWPSQGNFLLVQFADMQRLQPYLLERRILVRDFSDEAGLENCARITIGTSAENDALLEAIRTFGETL